MTTVTTPPGDYTFEDFCWIIPDGQKADLINGVIYIASPEYTDADALLGWLRTILSIYARRKNLGRVFGSRVAFRLNKWNSPEPDIAFVSRQRVEQAMSKVHRIWLSKSSRPIAWNGTT